MSVDPERKLNLKREIAMEIMAGCPMGSPLYSCPANKLRHLPETDQECFVNGLSEEELDAVIGYHCDCMKKRLQELDKEEN